MNNNGIGYVIVSQSAPSIQGVLSTANATKFATEINNEMYNTYISVYPDRFGFFATVPMQNPLAAASERERAVAKLKAKGAAINGYTDTGPATVRYLDDPINEPFWAKVTELNVPVYLHPRAPPLNQQMMYNNANNTHNAYPGLVTGGFGFTVEAAVSSPRLMLSGLFDRHPGIPIILGHAAEGLPFLIHRSDTQLAAEAPSYNGPHKRPMALYREGTLPTQIPPGGMAVYNTKNEEELEVEDLPVTDIRVGESPSDASSGQAWDSRPGGTWVLRSKFSGSIDQAVTEVNVLFGIDAVDPRPQWALMQSSLQLDAEPDIPVARLSVLHGRVKPRLGARADLRVRTDGRIKIVQISDTHMVTGTGVCKDAIDAHGKHLPESEADPLTVNGW
jgi:predicted TIM-barrel fold metal-dependent hydrolase